MTFEYSQFLGNFFVITNKFIILTIKFIKQSAWQVLFEGGDFWCHRNLSSSMS